MHSRNDSVSSTTVVMAIEAKVSESNDQPTFDAAFAPVSIALPANHDYASSSPSLSEDSLEDYQSSCTSIDEMSEVPVDHKLSSIWTQNDDGIILEPYNYIASLPQKDIRRQLMEAFNVWYKVDYHSSEVIARTVTMMHNASLLIDDIQDGSKLRRGVASAHEVYGVAQTINSANYVYFQAQQQLLELHNWPEAIKIFNKEMLNLHRGQGMELYWRDNLLPPTERAYLQMISNKTGGLFRLIQRLLQSASSVTLDVSQLTDVIGLEFQILDDYKNLCDDKMISQKGFFEDLTEGKFSYPISHAMWTDSKHKDEIIDMMRLKTEDDAVKGYAATCLRQAGSLAHTRKVIEVLDMRARDLLSDVVVPNPVLERLLDKLSDGLRACR